MMMNDAWEEVPETDAPEVSGPRARAEPGEGLHFAAVGAPLAGGGEEQAEEALREELLGFCKYVEEYVKVPLNQNQFDALVSWTYNLGPTNLKQSTMLKVLNEGNYDEVPEQIKRWNKARGQVLNGLVRRREAEAEMFVS